jgi:hypothetical protein
MDRGKGRCAQGSPIGPLCSRNARPQKALVGRAQWETNRATLLEESTSKLGGIFICLTFAFEE